MGVNEPPVITYYSISNIQQVISNRMQLPWILGVPCWILDIEFRFGRLQPSEDFLRQGFAEN